MRTALASAAVLLILCALAVRADAQPSLRVFWSDTTGSGVPGTELIEADPWDALTLDIQVLVDAVGLGGGVGLGHV